MLTCMLCGCDASLQSRSCHYHVMPHVLWGCLGSRVYTVCHRRHLKVGIQARAGGHEHKGHTCMPLYGDLVRWHDKLSSPKCDPSVGMAAHKATWLKPCSCGTQGPDMFGSEFPLAMYTPQPTHSLHLKCCPFDSYPESWWWS